MADHYEVLLTARKLGELSGTAPDDIERYTEQSLLPAVPTPAGIRYRPNAVEVVGFIRELTRTGFSPIDIHLIVTIAECTGGDGEWISLIIRQKVEEIREQIEALTLHEDVLLRLAERCSRDCGYVAAMVTSPQGCDVLQA